MRLSEWLTKNNVRRKDFAERIGVSPGYITALCNGTKWPGRDVVSAVLTETGGAVGPDDFLTEAQ